MFNPFYSTTPPWDCNWLHNTWGFNDKGYGTYIGMDFIREYVTPYLVNTWQEKATYYEKVQAVKKSSPSPLLLSLIQRMGN